MNWQALWGEGWVVAVHALMAMAAIVLGGIQLALPKGTMPHRAMGYAWVGIMGLVAISSFWIHDFRLIGPFSPIHLLSLFVLYTLARAILAARQGNIKSHKSSMLQLYGLGLIVTGAFTLIPNRAMYRVFFGN